MKKNLMAICLIIGLFALAITILNIIAENATVGIPAGVITIVCILVSVAIHELWPECLTVTQEPKECDGNCNCSTPCASCTGHHLKASPETLSAADLGEEGTELVEAVPFGAGSRVA